MVFCIVSKAVPSPKSHSHPVIPPVGVDKSVKLTVSGAGPLAGSPTKFALIAVEPPSAPEGVNRCA